MKKTKHSLQEGFSLVQGLILTAVVSGAAVIGTQQIQDQKLNQKRAQAKGEIGLLHDTIYSTLQNRDHCAGTFELAANNVGGFAKNIVSIASKDGNVLFTTNPEGTKDPKLTYMNGNISIKKMAVTSAGTDGLIDLVIDYNRLKVGPNPSDKTNASTIREKIQLKMQNDPKDGDFVGCYAVKNYAEDSDSNQKLGNSNSLKDFCESLGSLVKWNEQYQTCSIKKNICSDSQKLFIGMDSNGEAICKSIFDQMSFTDFIEPTQVLCNPPSASNVKFVEAGGKVKVDCGSTPYTPPLQVHRKYEAVNNPKPVSGKWSTTVWSECSTGANPTKTGKRICNNPPPSNGGANCPGDPELTQSCSCNAEKTCSQIEAGTCMGEASGNDSCGKSCGAGTLVCKKDCKPDKSCSEIKGSVCLGKPAGLDSCENDCGLGDKTTNECAEIKKDCVPTKSCSEIRSSTCLGKSAGLDSCDNDCGKGELQSNECKDQCVPLIECKMLEKNACWQETPVDSCGKTCGKGQKECKEEKTIKCEAQWCHLGLIRNATCYTDNSYVWKGESGACSEEDGGRVPCDDPTLCGGKPVKICTSCESIRANVCTTDDAGKNSCGNSCGKGTKVCTVTSNKTCWYMLNYNTSNPNLDRGPHNTNQLCTKIIDCPQPSGDIQYYKCQNHGN